MEKKDGERNSSVWGAVILMAAVIGSLVYFNVHSTVWDSERGLYGISFLTVFFVVLGGAVVVGLASLLIWLHAKKRRRTKFYDEIPLHRLVGRR